MMPTSALRDGRIFWARAGKENPRPGVILALYETDCLLITGTTQRPRDGVRFESLFPDDFSYRVLGLSDPTYFTEEWCRHETVPWSAIVKVGGLCPAPLYHRLCGVMSPEAAIRFAQRPHLIESAPAPFRLTLPTE